MEDQSTKSKLMDVFSKHVVRRLRLMDFEHALWQMVYLPFDPKRVYRDVYYHFQTKGKWARDDPAFLILLSWLICVSSFCFAFAFLADTPMIMLRVILWTVFVDLVATGVVTATLLWYALNRWLRERGTQDHVEWAYCFDVHCNAWFCLFLYVYMVAYLVLPALIVPNSWSSTLLSNAIYAMAITHYCWTTFSGYAALPFLRMTHVLVWPVIAMLIVMIVLTVGVKFNVVIFTMNLRYA